MQNSPTEDVYASYDNKDDQVELQTLKEQCTAMEKKLKILNRRNADLRRRNEFLKMESNVDKDILETIVQLRIEASLHVSLK